MGGNGKADLGKKWEWECCGDMGMGGNGNGSDAMGGGGSGNLKTHSRTPLVSICCNLQLGTLYYKHVIGRVRGLALVTAGTLRTAHEVVSSNPSGSVSMHKSAVNIYC